MEVDEAEEDEGEEELHFSAQDLTKIRDALVLLVQSLLRLLDTFPLKDRPECASNCTQVTSDSIVTLPSYHNAASSQLLFLCRSSVSCCTLSRSSER